MPRNCPIATELAIDRVNLVKADQTIGALRTSNLYWPEFTGGLPAEFVIEVCAGMPSAFIGRCWLAIINWVPNTKHMNITYTHHGLDLMIAPKVCGASFDRLTDPACRGSSTIKPAAILVGSRADISPSLKEPISEAKL